MTHQKRLRQPTTAAGSRHRDPMIIDDEIRHDLGCAYGCHSWVYNDPQPGIKRCTAGCDGQYVMVDVEQRAYPVPQNDESSAPLPSTLTRIPRRLTSDGPSYRTGVGGWDTEYGIAYSVIDSGTSIIRQVTVWGDAQPHGPTYLPLARVSRRVWRGPITVEPVKTPHDQVRELQDRINDPSVQVPLPMNRAQRRAAARRSNRG